MSQIGAYRQINGHLCEFLVEMVQIEPGVCLIVGRRDYVNNVELISVLG